MAAAPFTNADFYARSGYQQVDPYETGSPVWSRIGTTLSGSAKGGASPDTLAALDQQLNIYNTSQDSMGRLRYGSDRAGLAQWDPDGQATGFNPVELNGQQYIRQGQNFDEMNAGGDPNFAKFMAQFGINAGDFDYTPEYGNVMKASRYTPLMQAVAASEQKGLTDKMVAMPKILGSIGMGMGLATGFGSGQGILSSLSQGATAPSAFSAPATGGGFTTPGGISFAPGMANPGMLPGMAPEFALSTPATGSFMGSAATNAGNLISNFAGGVGSTMGGGGNGEVMGGGRSDIVDPFQDISPPENPQDFSRAPYGDAEMEAAGLEGSSRNAGTALNGTRQGMFSLDTLMNNPTSALRSLASSIFSPGGEGGEGNGFSLNPSSLFALGQGLYGLSESERLKRLSASMADRADPNAAYRPGYASMLNNLARDPSSVYNLPGWQAGSEAVQRSMAAQGYQGSGNMAVALQKYGGDFYNQALQQYGTLAGIGFNPASAAQIGLGGNESAINLAGQSLNSLGYGFGGGTGRRSIPIDQLIRMMVA